MLGIMSDTLCYFNELNCTSKEIVCIGAHDINTKAWELHVIM